MERQENKRNKVHINHQGEIANQTLVEVKIENLIIRKTHHNIRQIIQLQV
jgi:hypothetical protein